MSQEARMMRRLLFGALAIAGAVAAQTFEVATIKFHPEPITSSMDPSVRGARMTGTASTLVDMVITAYGLRYDQVSGGPGWANSDHFDLAAKAEGERPLTQDQARKMLQNLLADRFQLKVHRETKEVPVYALVVAKNGHKLKESSADATGKNFVRTGGGGMHMEAAKGTMEQLARQLSGTAGRPVIDKTGLTGYYAYTLDWSAANRTPETEPEPPVMFTALQEQLGLRLEAAKGPFEMLIIDHAEKPTEN